MLDVNYINCSSGVRMPKIIYGTAWKKERTAELVGLALQAGFTGIDTACQPKHYSEPLVGEAISHWVNNGGERQSLYVQTKFTPLDGQDPTQIPYDKTVSLKEQVRQSFEVSIKNLQTPYVDCLVLHSPLSSHDLTMQAWGMMENIYETGGARQLGISNCYDTDVFQKLYGDAKVKPVVLQNRFYKDTGYDVDLRRLCVEYDMIYQSFWTLTANPHILQNELLKTLGAKYKKTEAQVFFSYLSSSGIVPLTGTSSTQHMQEDLNFLDFTLSTEELNNIKLLFME